MSSSDDEAPDEVSMQSGKEQAFQVNARERHGRKSLRDQQDKKAQEKKAKQAAGEKRRSARNAGRNANSQEKDEEAALLAELAQEIADEEAEEEDGEGQFPASMLATIAQHQNDPTASESVAPKAKRKRRNNNAGNKVKHFGNIKVRKLDDTDPLALGEVNPAVQEFLKEQESKRRGRRVNTLTQLSAKMKYNKGPARSFA